MGRQCGGWTISWQGQAGPVTDGTTILQALTQALPGAVGLAADAAIPAGARTAVVVIGEEPYAEMMGDKKSLDLAPSDVALVTRMKAAGLRVVVVLVSGRPMMLEPVLAKADAIVAAWLPGTEGAGVADVLVGRYNPTGRLSHTWPRSMAQIPVNVGPDDEPPAASPLFAYGFGLSYK